MGLRAQITVYFLTMDLSETLPKCGELQHLSAYLTITT